MYKYSSNTNKFALYVIMISTFLYFSATMVNTLQQGRKINAFSCGERITNQTIYPLAAKIEMIIMRPSKVISRKKLVIINYWPPGWLLGVIRIVFVILFSSIKLSSISLFVYLSSFSPYVSFSYFDPILIYSYNKIIK